jgi:N-acyl-D-amino-acid deacylase
MPDAESHVRQGVTLALGGPDGGGPAPMAPYLARVQQQKLGLNVAFLTGHNTIRQAVMGTANRPATPDELTRMKRMVAESMGQGAFGLSTGLRYIPGFYSNTDEVVALSQVASDSGGIYTSHLREEALGLLDGVGEALEIGRRAKIPVVLTHHKVVGQKMWGKSAVTLAMVDSARRAGTDVMIDQYPYAASHTGIDILMPPWAMAGGDSALRRRLEDPVLNDSIEKDVIDALINDRGGGDLKRVQFSRVSWDSTLNGKTLYDLVTRLNIEPTIENAAPVVIDVVLKGGARTIFHVRDEKVLTLEQAVAKMTGMPAKRLGLDDHGCLRDGCIADITMFSAERVRDVGTYADPHHYPEGIPYVIVNGVPVIDNGTFTSARPGKVLRRNPGKRASSR